VHFAGFTDNRASPAPYRVEQLLPLDDSVTLYKIRNDSEPFDRVVAERDLTQAEQRA
jgi:hypothetical protein